MGSEPGACCGFLWHALQSQVQPLPCQHLQDLGWLSPGPVPPSWRFGRHFLPKANFWLQVKISSQDFLVCAQPVLQIFEGPNSSCLLSLLQPNPNLG